MPADTAASTPRDSRRWARVAKVQTWTDMRENIAGPGNVVGGGTPEDFGASIAAEGKRWGALIQGKGIRVA